MFDAKDILAFKTFCQEIINRPRPIEDQPFQREGVFLWCEDWEIIEICKYLFNGREAYYGDPPPNRLKFNPLWSKDKIAEITEALIVDLKTSEVIIDYLRKRRQ